MIVLITGGTGFIAKNLIRRLISNSEIQRIIVVVRYRNEWVNFLEKNNKIAIVLSDLENYSRTSFGKSKVIEYVFHFAWDGVHGNNRNDVKTQNKNVEYSLEFIEHLHRNYEVKCLFLGGSQAEYGEITSSIPIDETSSCNPTLEYGKAKLKLYNLISAKRFGFKVVECRFISLYGEDDFADTLVMYCIRKMKNNESLLLTSCENIWNYLYINDAINALEIMVLENEKVDSGIYNFCGDENIVLKNYVLRIKRLLGSNSQITFDNNRGPNLIYSNLKLRSVVNWQPKTTFEQGLLNICKKIE